MVSFWIGSSFLFLSCAIALLGIRSDPKSVKLRMILVVVASIVSGITLYLQHRSAIEAGARNAQMKDDLDRVFALAYKQETVRALEIRVSPRGCINPPPGEAASDPMWAPDLITLTKQLTGSAPARNETVIIELLFSWSPLQIALLGQAASTGTHWFVALASDDVAGTHFVRLPPTTWQPLPYSFLDLRLNEADLRGFLTNPPGIQDMVQYGRGLTAEFDPRFELGWFRLGILGIYGGAYDASQPPKGDLKRNPRWRDLQLPFDYLRCWTFDVSINGRRAQNVLASNTLLPDVRDRLLHWPSATIEPKLREGYVWLSLFPEDWRELRPLMNCRLAWLLYKESTLPCPAMPSQSASPAKMR